MCSDLYPIPILSLFFLYHPYIPHFLIQFFYFLVMYCLRYLLLYTCKQSCLQTCKYEQSLGVTETYIPTKFYGFLLELWELSLNNKEKIMKDSAHHSPIRLMMGRTLAITIIQSTFLTRKEEYRDGIKRKGTK